MRHDKYVTCSGYLFHIEIDIKESSTIGMQHLIVFLPKYKMR